MKSTGFVPTVQLERGTPIIIGLAFFRFFPFPAKNDKHPIIVHLIRLCCGLKCVQIDNRVGATIVNIKHFQDVQWKTLVFVGRTDGSRVQTP